MLCVFYICLLEVLLVIALSLEITIFLCLRLCLLLCVFLCVGFIDFIFGFVVECFLLLIMTFLVPFPAFSCLLFPCEFYLYFVYDSIAV